MPLNPTQQALIKRDLNAVWHPCTQMKDHETLPMIPIKRGQGVWLEDFEGKRYLDAISSWWVNLFGHANPKINAALCAQAQSLEQVMLAGFTHKPIIELSEQLINLTPNGLNKCFYADNGSSGVEVALKMSFHYWKNKNQPKKTRFITLENSYHGETLGALAVGNVTLYKDTYRPLLMEVLSAPSPDCFHRELGESWQAYSQRQLEPMKKLLEQHAHECCAVIIEPLVQCAGNMRMYDAIYLTGLRQLCDDYQIHLIADEIAVGFGRTGTMFACEQAHISPDFMCLSKGLTGGYLTLCAVLTTDTVYQAFYDDYANMTAFLHSHSYTGNPLACSVALATLDIFKQDNVIENNQKLAQKMAECCRPLNHHPHVYEVRQRGMIVAIEMIKNKAKKQAYPWQERRGMAVYLYALQHGVLLRPLGNVIYFIPPYVITENEIERMVNVAIKGINHATQGQK